MATTIAVRRKKFFPAMICDVPELGNIVSDRGQVQFSLELIVDNSLSGSKGHK